MNTQWKKRGLLVGLLVMAVLCVACGQEKKNEPFTYRAPSPKAEEQKSGEKKQETEYVICDINMEEETITLMSLDSNRPIRCKYNLSTKFMDKYKNSYSTVHFVPGQVVKLGEKNEDSVLESIWMSDTVWDYDDVGNYQLDTEKGAMEIGKSTYRITDDTLVFSGDRQADWDEIGTDDVLEVIGSDKQIISVMVTTGHGYIQLTNSGTFKDSMICIGNEIFTNITGDMKIEVPEGTYPITVAKDGYGGTAEFTVTRNETTVVDLDQLKGKGPKTCKLTLQTDVEGARVYIDGKQIEVGKELKVTYGSHKLSVVAEGYESWEKTLVVNSKSATIELSLTQQDSSGSSSTDSGSSDGNSATTGGSSNNSSTSGNNTSNSNSSSSRNASSSSTNNRSTQSSNSNSSTNNGSSSYNSSYKGNSSNKNSSSSGTGNTDVDYLTTISNMLNNLLQ